MQNIILVSNKDAKNMRLFLQENNFESKDWLLQKILDKVAIPINNDFIKFSMSLPNENYLYMINNIAFTLDKIALKPNLKGSSLKPLAILENILRQSHLWNEKVQKEIPKTWEIYDDLLLVSSCSFSSDFWNSIDDSQWKLISSAFKCNRIARKSRINNDKHRTPAVQILLGDNGWVETVNNGIKYRFDITKCMFSPGNITEKLRISQFCCSNETVVDLYAGIGYFTLPYLVHAKAKHVIACEWNKNAIEALKINLDINNVRENCTILEGDNRITCPTNIADRVNLGLIPSSKDGWLTACTALKTNSGGVLHVHANVTTSSRKNLQKPEYFYYGTESLKCDLNHSFNKDCQESESQIIDQNKYSTLPNVIGTSEDTNETHLSSEKLNISNKEDITFNSSYNLYPNIFNDNRLNERLSDGICNFHYSNEPYKNKDMYILNNKKKLSFPKITNKPEWNIWSQKAANDLNDIFFMLYKTKWQTIITNIEHVKSYAPYIDHIVVDILCKPCTL